MLRRSSAFKTTTQQFLNIIRSTFKLYDAGDMSITLVRSSADLKQFGRLNHLQASEEGAVAGEDARNRIRFPHMRVALAQISLDTQKAGYKPSRITVAKDIRQGQAYFDTLKPINVMYGASLATDNLEHILIFANLLMHAAPKILIPITMDSGFIIETSVMIDPNLTIPQADLSSPGDPYVFETTFTVNSYMGLVTEGRLIAKTQLSSILKDTTTDAVVETTETPFYDVDV